MANNTGTFFNINDNDGIPLVGVSTNGKVMINHLYGNCLIGSTSVTGTASQPLQVTGGAYVSGNLGIGETNPARILDIYSASGANTVKLTANGTSAGFVADSVGVSSRGGYFSAYQGGVQRAIFGVSGTWEGNTTSDAAIGADTGGSIRFYTNGSTEKARLDTSGNLGIGTTNPAKRLHVQTGYVSGAARGGSFTQTLFEGNNTAANYWEFQAPSTAANDILFSKSNVGGSSYGIVGYDHSVDALRFYTNGTECLRLDSNGFAKHTGSIGRGAPVTKTSSFSVGIAENWIICNGTASITVTLPTASAWTGREIMLKTIAAFTVVSASSNVVPLAGGAAGTAILTNVAGRWATLVSDGTNWIVMNAN